MEIPYFLGFRRVYFRFTTNSELDTMKDTTFYCILYGCKYDDNNKCNNCGKVK